MRLKEPFRSPGHWRHITQRGNDRQRVLSDADRQYFLDLLAVGSQERAVRVAAYNLMSNHFHSVAIGDQADTISPLMIVTSALHPRWLDTKHFQRHGRHGPTPGDWRNSLGAFTSREFSALRMATRYGTALGSDDFVQQLEQTYSVQLPAKPLGWPRSPSTAQSSLPAPTKTRSA